jgi:type IV pilus assembly protein PilP
MMGGQDMMSNTARLCIITIFIVAIVSLFACSEDPPPAPQTQVVKKKISGQQQKSKTQPVQTVAQSQTAQAKDDVADKVADKKDAPAIEQPAKDESLESELVKASLATAGAYNPKGRFDPFEPLFKTESEQQPAAKPSRKRRTPKTPLERVALSQLKLSAIMRTAKGNSAIVEDATGKGYVIRKGTYIGLNSGQVVQIEKDRVMIEEESEDISGEFRIENTELKLQKPAGEL